MGDYPKPQPLDFQIVQADLDSLIRNTIHKIERVPPAQLANVSGAQPYYLIALLMAENAYRTIRYLAADIPADPHRRKSYLLSVAPLTRTIVDTIFNIIFLQEALGVRFPWFQKAGWREGKETYDRWLREYGHFLDWQEYLRGFEQLIVQGASLHGVAPAEVLNPKLIQKWPNPGAMPMFGVGGSPQTPDQVFLQYLSDWFYKSLSQEAHLSLGGAMRVGIFALRDLLSEDEKEKIDGQLFDKLKAAAVGQTLTLMLALLSEVEAFMKFGNRSKLQYLWVLIGAHSPETKEVYDRRYAALLA